MRRKTFFSLITILLLSFSSFGFGCDKPSSDDQQKDEGRTSPGSKNTTPLEVGVLLPLTGSGATWGGNAKNGIQLALEEINDGNGVHGRSIKLQIEDTKSKPKAAVSAFRRVVNQHGVNIAIIDMISSNVLAVAPIAEQEKVTVISPGASNPKISDAGDFVFRNWPSDALQGKLDARYAHNILGWERAAILAIRNDYGDALSEVFQKKFKKLGGKVTFADSFAQGASDFRQLITKLKGKEFDGIFIPGYPKEIPLLARQLREQGVEAPLLGTESFEDESIVSKGGDAVEGAHYSIPRSPDESSPVVKKFKKDYKERFEEKPGVPADVAYDALHILAWAARNVSTDLEGDEFSKAVRDQLYELEDYEGAAGPTTFNEKGDAVKPFTFKVITNGEFKRAEKQLN